jgi:hypothetical protein
LEEGRKEEGKKEKPILKFLTSFLGWFVKINMNYFSFNWLSLNFFD